MEKINEIVVIMVKIVGVIQFAEYICKIIDLL